MGMTIEEANGNILRGQWKTAAFLLAGVSLIFWLGYNFRVINALESEVAVIAERQRDVRERLSASERTLLEQSRRIDYFDHSDERWREPSRIPNKLKLN